MTEHHSKTLINYKWKEISKRLYASLCEAPTEVERNRRGRLMLGTIYAMGSSKSMSDIVDIYFLSI